MYGGSELLEFVAALRFARGTSGGLHGRQQQPHEDPDNGDHHENFDQREP